MSTAESIANNDAIASIAGKLTVASGTGTAVYGAVNAETMIAVAGAFFTIASFFLNWYYEQRAKKLRQREVESNIALQREKNELEYRLQRQRIEMENFDRAEQRRIMQEQFERVEARKKEESNARIVAMQGDGRRSIFAPDSIIGAAIDIADMGGAK